MYIRIKYIFGIKRIVNTAFLAINANLLKTKIC